MRCETPKSRLQVVKDVGRLLWPATKKMHSILILTMNRFRRGWLLSLWSSCIRFHIQNIPKHPKNVFPSGAPSTHTVQLGLVVASRLVAFLEHPRTQAGASGCCSNLAPHFELVELEDFFQKNGKWWKGQVYGLRFFCVEGHSCCMLLFTFRSFSSGLYYKVQI